MTDFSANPAVGEKPLRTPARRRIFDTSAISPRLLLKLCCGLSLVLLLAMWFDISNVVHELFTIDARFVVVAIVLFAFRFVLSCLRWVYILDREHLHIGYRNALSVFGIGTLANLFLVTSIAGMSVRTALLVRSGVGMSGALACITAERIAATTGLFVCAIAGLAFGLPELQQHFGKWLTFRSGVTAATILACLALAVAAAVCRIPAVRTFAGKVWLVFSSPWSAFLLCAISAAAILLGFAGLAMLAFGMGLRIDPVFFISVMPAIAFVAALPISVGGWGVREGAMAAGLTLFSVPPDSAVALSISYGLGGLLVALLLGTLLALLGNAQGAHKA